MSASHREPPPHGSHSRYNNHGCRCSECVRARSIYLREYTIRRAHADVTGRRKLPTITEAIRPPEERGPVELAVAAEIAEYPLAVERPALAAVALVLGRDLDCATFTSSHSRLAAELKRVLDVLTAGPRGRGRKLATVTTSARR